MQQTGAAATAATVLTVAGRAEGQLVKLAKDAAKRLASAADVSVIASLAASSAAFNGGLAHSSPASNPKERARKKQLFLVCFFWWLWLWWSLFLKYERLHSTRTIFLRAMLLIVRSYLQIYIVY